MKKIEKIVAIQGDPLHLINRKTDTTLLLALEAQRRNYKIYYYQTKNLTFANNKVTRTQILLIKCLFLASIFLLSYTLAKYFAHFSL